MTADEPMSTPDSGGLREAVIQRLTETIEHEKRWSVMGREGDVRCLSCDLRYAERQEYGCHREGNAHSYDDEELAEARSEQPHDADSLMVDALAALLAAHPEPVSTPDSADDATVGEREATPCGARVCSGCATCAQAAGYPRHPDGWIDWEAVARASNDPATPPADGMPLPAAGHPASPSCSERSCGQPPAADDANRAPVSGGLDEGERVALFFAAKAEWLPPMGRDPLENAVDRILAARDAAWVERLAAVEGERDDWKATAWGNADLVAGLVARAESAEAERDTARREAGERIAQAKAEALRAAADEWKGGPTGEAPIPRWWLRDRADALTSDDGSGA